MATVLASIAVSIAVGAPVSYGVARLYLWRHYRRQPSVRVVSKEQPQ